MEKVPYPKRIKTDADSLAANTEHAILVLEISRQEIEAGNYTSSLERLMVMADSRESTLRYRESLFLTILCGNPPRSGGGWIAWTATPSDLYFA